MSTFPYPPTEQYPTDADHQQYLTEWNTRYEATLPAAQAAPQPAPAPAPSGFLQKLTNLFGMLMPGRDSSSSRAGGRSD